MTAMPTLLLTLALATGDVRPANPGAPEAPRRLRWSPKVDLSVTGALGAGWLLSEFAFKSQLAPAQCHWCATNGFDTAVRSAFDVGLSPSWSVVASPDLASNVVGFVGVPLAMLGLDALFAHQAGALADAFPVDALLILEATFAAMALDQSVKFLAGRARPYTVGASPELLASRANVSDQNLSFFSGHTTLVFGLVSATGTIATLRGYRYAWVTWLVGVPLATATAVLRLAADQHWASDVLVGMAVGAGLGAAIPLLFHGREEGAGPTVRLVPAPGGLLVSGTF